MILFRHNQKLQEVVSSSLLLSSFFMVIVLLRRCSLCIFFVCAMMMYDVRLYHFITSSLHQPPIFTAAVSMHHAPQNTEFRFNKKREREREREREKDGKIENLCSIRGRFRRIQEHESQSGCTQKMEIFDLRTNQKGT